MIVVDSAVWVDWFNRVRGLHSDWLDRALSANEEILTVPLIIAEVLQGFRDDREFENARSVLAGLRSLGLDDSGYVAAARLYRTLRRRGVTVRGLIDCIIAQTCLATGAELLSPDRDFVSIAKHTSLKICRV